MNTINAINQIDFAAFSAPVSNNDIKRYGVRRKGAVWTLVFVITLFNFLLFPSFLAYGAITLIALIFGIVSLFSFVFGLFMIQRGAIQEVRLCRFAEKNSFSYVAEIDQIQESGTLFQNGDNRKIERVIEGSYGQLQFKFGDYSCSQRSGKSRDVYRYGFMSTSLPRPVPQVILDSRFGSSTFNFTSYIGSEALMLEGDFNKFFNVRIPKGYGADVLYFLTPELMEMLKLAADVFDVEFIDDKLYFYSSKKHNVTEADLRLFFNVIEKISLEAWDNTRRYVDARLMGVENSARSGARIAMTSLSRVIYIIVIGLAAFILAIVAHLM